jgi:hypothetical protein
MGEMPEKMSALATQSSPNGLCNIPLGLTQLVILHEIPKFYPLALAKLGQGVVVVARRRYWLG